MNPFALALLAFAGLAVIFAGVFWIARRIDNYGVVDIAWSLRLDSISTVA